ncbi:MAG: 3-methyl-2-oxobutanoate dehydrogenase subunit VorB [Clostridiales bacterium]|jgi:2-oxoglutarate ferredoxin oxidoreductase subunit alpha|nr:3-methyl-2-oxobutanoate dehydrogenase subunit VorB [Clostridiales bacterium]
MGERVLMKGNEAVAEAAVRGGCRYFFGYPITPQNEIPEYMSRRMPEVGGAFIQAESEVSAINMVYGAAGAGGRAMTSSSSPGISLKQEGISYIAAAELPCVIVNMVRSGPGLGGILPSQGDYFQAVKGGGHGDYRMLVYGPGSIQEAVDLVYGAFGKAEKYRIPVMILGDGILGQMMEPVTLPEMLDVGAIPKKEWATDGTKSGKDRRVVNSLYIEADVLEGLNRRFKAVYERLKDETACETYLMDDAEVALTAFGTTARIAKSAAEILRGKGVKAGLIRPITLYPFPSEVYAACAAKKEIKKFIALELNSGQMVEDVRLAVNGAKPVEFYGRSGGNVMSPEEMAREVMKRL